MEERNKVTSISKSDDPEKLVVFHAASLQNEIRFYLNDTQYLTAVECEKLSSIPIGIAILVLISFFYLSKIIDSILVFLIIMNIICFVINIVNVVIMETMETSPAIKSKHSAEHMMVNFLEINKRLPKNIEEVKKSSRFSPKCGSRELIKGIAEELIRSIVATIFTVIVSIIVSHFSSNSVTNEIVFLSTYFLTKFVVGKAITKYGALNFIIKPIKGALTNIAQCANTTSKVKDEDIILAYSVAKQWLQVVYPEFYNENEDIFWKQYLKVNN